jgi:hypothetical protein
MFKAETGVKTVEHKTIIIQQRLMVWAIAAAFIAGFGLNAWSTSTVNAAEKSKEQLPSAIASATTLTPTSVPK